MRYLLIAFVLFAACKQQPDQLEEKEQTIELTYIAWACACANWATAADIEKYNDKTDLLAAHCIFIDPADTSLHLPDLAGTAGQYVRFTGRFYTEKGVPGIHEYGEDKPDKARIFRYTKYEVLPRLYSEPFAGLEGKIPDTLVITYQSAVIFAPDSFKINKQIKAVGEENYKIGYDDEAGLFQQADEFFESVKLPSVFADSCNYLKFVQQNGTITIIKTDSLKDLYGLFLFDPKKSPKLADVTMAEEEYAKYFK
jgi:hypothetical protein